MALLDVNWHPNRRELRQFALIWIGFFALVGGYFWWSAGLRPAIVWWVVAAAGLIGAALPGVFRPIYVLWMLLALPIGWTVSHLLLLIVYYVVLTPIGLLMRLVGYDPLKRQADPAAKTYWVTHEQPADMQQYFKQY